MNQQRQSVYNMQEQAPAECWCHLQDHKHTSDNTGKPHRSRRPTWVHLWHTWTIGYDTMGPEANIISLVFKSERSKSKVNLKYALFCFFVVRRGEAPPGARGVT